MERGLGEYYHSPVVKRKEESIGEKAECYECKEQFYNFALNASAKKGSTKQDKLYIILVGFFAFCTPSPIL